MFERPMQGKYLERKAVNKETYRMPKHRGLNEHKIRRLGPLALQKLTPHAKQIVEVWKKCKTLKKNSTDTLKIINSLGLKTHGLPVKTTLSELYSFLVMIKAGLIKIPPTRPKKPAKKIRKKAG
ncbi:MAG: hypothetical protein Q7K42_03655 [Candidatus Diapherotrites archaeon]|nr:hypothetical protein [Candidatus Diapherotrites archaeon]